MKKEVMIVTGAGQIGMALARRIGFGKKIILGDKNLKNAEAIAEIMNNAGYDVVPFPMDLSSRKDILAIIAKAQEYGEIKYLINAAGVSPSQAPIEARRRCDDLKSVRLAHASADPGRRPSACHDADRGTAESPSPAA